MLWQKSRSCLKSFPWKTKAEWHLQLQKEQTPSHAELLPVSSEKCCSLILVQMRFRNCHCNPKYCNPLVLVFAGRSVVADDDCSTQWGLRAHTPWSLPSEPCVQADWKAAGWESCGVFFIIFIYLFYERHSPCTSPSRIISWCSKPDVKGRMVHFVRTSPREHCNVILFFLSRYPLRNFLQCRFPFPAVCSCSSSWLLNDGVSHAWVTSVGNLQSFVFFHILFLGHLLATCCTYTLATRIL